MAKIDKCSECTACVALYTYTHIHIYIYTYIYTYTQIMAKINKSSERTARVMSDLKDNRAAATLAAHERHELMMAEIEQRMNETSHMYKWVTSHI